MKIKLDESKVLEFKIDTSSGCVLEDVKGYLRFSFGGVEYGFRAKVEEGHFKVSVPPLQNVISSRLTESISKNKELVVEGRLDVFTGNSYVVPWNGKIEIDIPVSMEISEGGTLDEKKKITVTDPEKDDILNAYDEVFNPDKLEEAVKASKFKDALDKEKEIEEEDPTDEEVDEMCGADHKKKKKKKNEEPDPIPVKKSRFAQSLEKTYVKEA